MVSWIINMNEYFYKEKKNNRNVKYFKLIFFVFDYFCFFKNVINIIDCRLKIFVFFLLIYGLFLGFDLSINVNDYG